MPRYSARVFILRNGKQEEDILLERIHASSLRHASAIVATNAHNYIQLQKNIDPAYGYKIDYCMRTKVLDTILAGNKSAFTNEGTVVKVQPPVNLNSSHKAHMLKLVDKFEDEVRGDFTSPFTFEDGVILTLNLY